MHHLMIHCFFASIVWSAIIKMFEMEWVMPRTVDDLVLHWRLSCDAEIDDDIIFVMAEAYL